MMETDRELYDQALERAEAMETLAERILAECRVTLMMSFRFLDQALWKLPYRSLRSVETPPILNASMRTALSTDGHALYYDANAVIQAFRVNPDLVVRSYLHALLHCIFRHPFRTVRADTDLWSLACDVCVESIALEMCDGRFALDDDGVVREFAERVSEQCAGSTPNKVYRALLLGKRECGTPGQVRLYAELNGNGVLFARDDHQLWDLAKPPQEQKPPEDRPDDGSGSGQADDQDGKQENPEGGDPQDAPDGEGEGPGAESAESAESADDAEPPSGDGGEDGEGADGLPEHEDQQESPPEGGPAPRGQQAGIPEPEYSEGDALAPDESRKDDEEDWEHIAQQVETELRTMEKERGDGAGSFMDNLALANRSRVDYADFLRRFATRAEDVKLNDEEFDYVFYTYGLKLYGNMPLVEPLEYAETERIREFVIAIDTSGSCSRGLVQVFLTRTYEILSRGRAFDERVNVHIVQCDAEVQSVDVIHDIGELAAYGEGFEVRGYGGTDFRPVFAYVDDLLARRELTDLRGLVYFTDGYGTFPTQAPGYDVAFVFVEEDGKERRVPPWAMKVVLDEDSLYEMEALEPVPGMRSTA